MSTPPAAPRSAARAQPRRPRSPAAWLGLLLVAAAARAGGPDGLPVDTVAAGYVQPQQRIDMGEGRAMNLYCLGHGRPTVVFESGLSDWSSTWALIQPAVARLTRACSYDRPGMGYSDAAARPPTPFHAVDDLHTLLQRGGVDGPLLLVGHSLGGFYMKLYAALYPQQVAGLLLVDPSEERLWARVGPQLARRFGARLVRAAAADDRSGIDAAIAHFRDCAAASREGRMDEATYARCSDPVRAPLGAAILAERRRLQPLPAYQSAQADELAHSMFVPDAAADARYARLFGHGRPFHDLPLVVLTHSFFDMTPPYGEIGYAAWLAAHRQTAALSRRGIQRMVPLSRHNLQVEQPQVVIDAIAALLQTLPRDQTVPDAASPGDVPGGRLAP